MMDVNQSVELDSASSPLPEDNACNPELSFLKERELASLLSSPRLFPTRPCSRLSPPHLAAPRVHYHSYLCSVRFVAVWLPRCLRQRPQIDRRESSPASVFPSLCVRSRVALRLWSPSPAFPLQALHVQAPSPSLSRWARICWARHPPVVCIAGLCSPLPRRSGCIHVRGNEFCACQVGACCHLGPCLQCDLKRRFRGCT